MSHSLARRTAKNKSMQLFGEDSGCPNKSHHMLCEYFHKRKSSFFRKKLDF